MAMAATATDDDIDESATHNGREHMQPHGPSVDARGNTYPEGGRKAWLVTYGSWSGMTASFGLMNTIGAFQAYLSTHQLASSTPSTIGWIFSLYTFISFFCGVQIGPVFDAKGPRGLIALGTVALLGGIFAVAQSTQLWHFFLSFSLLCGLGTSLIFTPAVSSVAHYFLRRRGAATGLATTGGSVGGIVYPLMLQSLFPRVGYAWAVRILGFVFIAQLLVANLLVRSRLPRVPLPATQKKARRLQQQEEERNDRNVHGMEACKPSSQTPDTGEARREPGVNDLQPPPPESEKNGGANITANGHVPVPAPPVPFSSTSSSSSSQTSKTTDHRSQPSRFQPLITVLRTIFFLPPLHTLFLAKPFPNAFLLTTFGTFFLEWSLFIPISTLTSFALEALPNTSTGTNSGQSFPYILLSILNVGSFFGRWLPAGFLADRWGRYNMQIACTCINILALLAFWLPCTLLFNGYKNLPPSEQRAAQIPTVTLKALLTLFALFFGFGSGSNISLVPVCIGQLCPTEVFGTWLASCYTIVSFGCLLGLPIAGALLSVNSSGASSSSSSSSSASNNSGGGGGSGGSMNSAENGHGHDNWLALVLFTTGCYIAALGFYIAARWRVIGWRGKF